MDIATIEHVPLEFKTPYDELAELTGLRRETISRARPDSRFQRRTEKALGDLYAVVARMRSVRGDESGQMAAILRRPQPEFMGRSIADLLREGQVGTVLESLSPESPPNAGAVTRNPTVEERVAALLDGDPRLCSQLPAIEAALLRHFGPGATVERKLVNVVWDDLDGRDELYVRVHNDLSLDENIERQANFLRQEGDLLAPVWSRLSFGFIG